MNKKKYFIADDDEQKGPFSFNELQEMGISKTTLIWKEGFVDWTEAGKIEKFQSLLKITPPKLPKKEEIKKTKDKTLNVNLALGKPKSKIELKEKELSKEKLKTSIAKNTTYYTKRILISILIFIVVLIGYLQIESRTPKYSEPGIISEDYERLCELSDIVFVVTLCVCFFMIFGKPLSQILGWFNKYSEKEI